MKATIIHNPRCSKSRQALALLEEKNSDVEIILYLQTGLDKKELQSVLKKLDMSARDVLRKGEAIYKELKAQQGEPDDNMAIDWIVKHPILLERPIVVVGEKAVIGRPPENVLTLLK